MPSQEKRASDLQLKKVQEINIMPKKPKKVEMNILDVISIFSCLNFSFK